MPAGESGLIWPYAALCALLNLVFVQSSSCPSTPYLVHQGDYICNITNHFGITSDALLTANPGVLLNNSRDNLKSGITLSLPCAQAPCCPAWTYAARAGDSYYSISMATGVDFDKLRQANNISTTDPACCNITCGDSIVVPCSPQMASCVPQASPPPPPVFAPPPPVVVVGAPPFIPLKFQFWVPNMTAVQVSSPHTDSDYVSVFCKVNGIDSSDSPNVSGELDMHSGQTRHRWNGCQAIATTPNSIVTMGFSIVNSGADSRLPTIFSDTTNLTNSVLSATGESAWAPVVSQAGTLLADLFPNCDGLVAADGLYFMASNYSNFNLLTQNHIFQRSYYTSHCNETSRYSVQFLAVLVGQVK